MKSICFESYRQSKRERLLQAKPRPRQLDPTWYTDNIYSNRSEDLEEDYMPECLRYGTYRKLRNIREQDERDYYARETRDMQLHDEVDDVFEDDVIDDVDAVRGGRADGAESSSNYGLQRSRSCKEFQYPKSQSCCFTASGGVGAYDGPPTASILKKNRTHVPKSYSFSASTRTAPFDVMDYELPPPTHTRRDKQEAFRRSMATGYPLDAHTCCARERCTSSTCLCDEMYSSCNRTSRAACRSGLGVYGADASAGSNRNMLADWDDRCSSRRAAVLQQHRELAPPTMVCCCTAAEECCCQRQQQFHMAMPPPRPRSRLRCPSHHPAAEEEEHFHCRAVDAANAAAAASYDADLEHFIRDERERLLLQDKFLDEDERYLAAEAPMQYARRYRRPARSKSLLEVQPPSRYDDDEDADSCSDSTQLDLEDFNIDLEKYWEELEKPPSPIDMRNMRSNLKVKQVNVGCYNNGQPIVLHDREQERLLIKKSLLEGLPSPPQQPSTSSQHHHQRHHHNNASREFHFFEQAACSPLHQTRSTAASAAAALNPFHGVYAQHKVYPEPLPSYKYNNFYPETHTVQTQQPTAGSMHHPAGGGGNSALSLINNIFSIYKPNKYSPHNCQLNVDAKPEPCKKMNVPSTRRPLGAPHSEYMHSMKRPLIVSTEQPHFKIIPEKTGLKISPLYRFDDYGEKPQARHKLTSTARPLMLPH